MLSRRKVHRRPGIGPAKILCVDDDLHLTDLLRYVLARDGYQPYLAHSGAEALLVAESIHLDAVILDANLPDMDGFLLCARFRTLCEAPVIMLTSRCTEVDVLTGFKQGADDYITKPFSMQILLQRVAVILRRQQDAYQPGISALR